MRPATRLVLLMVMLQAPLSAATDDAALRTRAELSGFTETSRAEDVTRVLGALQRASPSVHVTEFGRSQEARPLPLAVVSSPGVKDAAAARRSGKPRVLVLANIHAGEVEGKEAALILARRLTLGDLRPLAPRLVVLFAPLYNADGNERISLDHRPEQFGPLGGVGTRENAAGLDLNRDFTKLETPESRALAGLLNEWDPQVVIDLHTTNGSYHAYHLTYAPTLAVGADPTARRIHAWLAGHGDTRARGARVAYACLRQLHYRRAARTIAGTAGGARRRRDGMANVRLPAALRHQRCRSAKSDSHPVGSV